jgi:hypothetical protein
MPHSQVGGHNQDSMNCSLLVSLSFNQDAIMKIMTVIMMAVLYGAILATVTVDILRAEV